MFRAFRIGFTITGRNYTDELQNFNSDEYEIAAVEILAQVSLFVKPSSEKCLILKVKKNIFRHLCLKVR